MNRRVVVTGMGVITPLGNQIETFWQNLIAGKNGVGRITKFPINEQFGSQIAAEVKDFDITQYIPAKDARKMDPSTHYALIATKLALEDSGLNLDHEDRERIGVIVSSGIGGLATMETEFFTLFNKGPKRVSPFFVPMIIADIIPGHISMMFNLKGPNYSIMSACASSSHSLGDSLRLIQRGDAEIMVAGGTEATITPMGIAGFSALRALSTRNDDPEHASRPFDALRDGFVMGEGAGILILEELNHALNRQAKIYGEFVGYACTADSYHITAPTPGGEGAIRAMKLAIRDAGLTSDDIDYINAHGTSTPPNDRTETQAIKTLFGERAYQIPVNSTKSMIGHLLGASGAIEFITVMLSLGHQQLHPTRNQLVADPECDLNYVPNVAIQKELEVAISNSFGFGGHNVCLVAKRYQKD
ncbi:beta-ketoacyl-ACP synthase II [candidate division KSB1 bacterium]|nr:beta-ketoacyl-ACP synthase II [candidate division KSB1 bacterium]